MLSPGTERLDRLRKLALCARFGVPHHWIVDIENRATEEYVLAGDVHRPRSVVSFDEPFQPAPFPGVAPRLGEVEFPG